jgi:hypothetical protein
MKNLINFEEHLQEKNWIAGAVSKNPGALRKQMGLKKGETLTKKEVSSEISKLASQDQDPDKEGVQLPPAKAKKYKRLNLAKNLMNLGEDHSSMKNYMFFQNILTISDQCEKILEMDPKKVDSILDNGHGWALDHIATSKDDVEEVANFLKAEIEGNSYAHSQEIQGEEPGENPEVIITDNEKC